MKTKQVSFFLAVAIGCAHVASGARPARSLSVPELAFEPNYGQFNRAFDYMSTGSNYAVYVNGTGFQFEMAPGQNHTACLRLEFTNGRPTAPGHNLDPLPMNVTYFTGNDPNHFIYAVPTYGRIEYANVWPGINVLFHETDRHLEYDFVVAPGADTRNVGFRIPSATALKIDSRGDLGLRIEGADLALTRPVAFQNIDGRKYIVAARYRLSRSGDISIEVGPYDRSEPLIIDPFISYKISSFEITNVEASGTGVTVDRSGTAWVSGTTFPLSQNDNRAWTTAYAAGIAPSGNISIARIGGPGGDTTGNAVAVDTAGFVYLTGGTQSTGLSITNNPPAFQTQLRGGIDAFLFKFSLDPNQQIPLRAYSTYLGGSGNDTARAIAVDTSGNAYIAGETASSTDFPNTVAGSVFGGVQDGFVSKISTTTGALTYSRYIGGSDFDRANAIAVDTSGNAYVGGITASADFQPSVLFGYLTGKTTGANQDGFVLALNPSATAAFYRTFFSFAPIKALALVGPYAYVTGETNGSITTTSNAFQATGGSGHAFVAKFDLTSGSPSGLIYSTYLAGSGTDIGEGIAADWVNAFVSGTTSSTNFPTTDKSISFGSGSQTTSDGFITAVNTVSGAVPYSTFLGATLPIELTAAAADSFNNVFVAGDFFNGSILAPSPFRAIAAKAVLEVGMGLSRPQLFLQNQTSNSASTWFMTGLQGATLGPTPIYSPTPAAGWILRAAADMNADGIPDLIYQNQTTNQISIWYMSGFDGTILTSGPVVATAAPNWHVAAVGDFNRDGTPDFVLQNESTLQVSIWYMNPGGNNSYSSAPVIATAAPGWKVVGAGDFNLDGIPDLVLQNQSTNQISFWYMSGPTGSQFSSAPIIGTAATGWTVVGVSDFNQDGTSDLVLQNQSTNGVSVWYMGGSNGATLTSAPIIATAASGWLVKTAR